MSSQPVVAEGLLTMLARHPDHIAISTIPESGGEDPDVVLYDVLGLADGVDGVDGVDGADLDHLVNESTAVVLAVGRELRPDLLAQALSRGVDGFISMGLSEDELLAAIDSATTGWRPTDDTPDPVVGSSDSAQRAKLLGADVGLSPRETRILALIAQGLSNADIARRDFLSINSVKTYIRSAYAKIGVHSRSQAVAWAIRHGFATHGEWATPEQDARADAEEAGA